MIKTNNLFKRYGDLVAVNDVSFEIGSGEIVGLLGHNGAGKTTIMKIITGYLEPSSGTVMIDGMELSEQRTAIQSKIGYLPENCPLYHEMTVIDYLDYVAGLSGLCDTDSIEAVRFAIQQTQLREKATQTISTLSRGFRQRVGVAQAILSKPEILILDEPTNGLDPSQIQIMREMIIELGKQSTVILSTHILQEVHAVCDRVLIIKDGRLALDSRLRDLQSSRRLLVTVDQRPDIIQDRLSAVAGVQSVDFLFSEDSRNHYSLVMDSLHRSVDELVMPVARAIIDRGYQLYGIHPEKKDLETVFSEINSADTRGQVDAA